VNILIFLVAKIIYRSMTAINQPLTGRTQSYA